MTVVKEVTDLLKLVAEGISNVRTIVDAARDGREYLHQHHKDAETDLASLLEEIGKLTESLAEGASIVTHFAFTVSGSDLDRQPARFNDHLEQRQAVFARFDSQLEKTKASCSKIGHHAYLLQEQAKSNGMHNLFGLMNAGKRRAEQMSVLLFEVYGNDTELLEEFKNMARAVKLALADVHAVLAPRGQARPENVETASERLWEYSKEFLPVQAAADDTKRELHSLVNELRFPHLMPASQQPQASR
jgi:hypothetical protein